MEFKIFDFDVSKFDEKDQRGALVYIARIAESAERYDGMSRVMRKLVEHVSVLKVDLTVEERNLLSVAYKNTIGARRASWRTLAAEDSDQFADLFKAYRAQVEKELEMICHDVLDLLENNLIKNAASNKANEEAKVFYLKMAGDYYRYRAESVVDKNHDRSAAKFYADAYKLAEESLAPTHPIRLGLALNYSVCHYEILKDKKKACELAKNAFDAAISKLDKLEENDYKDSTLIMQLLRDNLTLWTSDNQDNDDLDVQDLDA